MPALADAESVARARALILASPAARASDAATAAGPATLGSWSAALSGGDADGDGLADVLVTTIEPDFATSVTLLAGSDGHVLWRRAHTPSEGIVFGWPTSDLDGDGLADAFVNDLTATNVTVKRSCTLGVCREEWAYDGRAETAILRGDASVVAGVVDEFNGTILAVDGEGQVGGSRVVHAGSSGEGPRGPVLIVTRQEFTGASVAYAASTRSTAFDAHGNVLLQRDSPTGALTTWISQAGDATGDDAPDLLVTTAWPAACVRVCDEVPSSRAELVDGATGSVAWSRVLDHQSLSRAGADLDGDGKDDLFVGNDHGCPIQAVSGATGATLWAEGVCDPPTSIGPVNDAPGADVGTIVTDYATWARRFDGATGTLLFETQLPALPGQLAGAYYTLDADGDGVRDVVSRSSNASSSLIHVESGRTGASLHDELSPRVESVLTLARTRAEPGAPPRLVLASVSEGHVRVRALGSSVDDWAFDVPGDASYWAYVVPDLAGSGGDDVAITRTVLTGNGRDSFDVTMIDGRDGSVLWRADLGTA